MVSYHQALSNYIYNSVVERTGYYSNSSMCHEKGILKKRLSTLDDLLVLSTTFRAFKLNRLSDLWC